MADVLAPPPAAWKQARILPRLYEREAAALVGAAPCVVITTFRLGFGWLGAGTGGVPEPLPPPSGADDIPGVLYEGEILGAPNGTTALVQCLVPEGAVSSPAQASVIGLFDQTGALVAAVTFLPEWITPDKRYEHHVHVTFPTE